MAGYAPDAKSHTVSATTEEIVFQLGKGSVIRGTVQEESRSAMKLLSILALWTSTFVGYAVDVSRFT